MSNHKPGVVCYQCPECKMRSASDGYRIGVTDGERLEREVIVAWLRSLGDTRTPLGAALSANAAAIERGDHIDGLREGGGATRSSLGNRPPHLSDDDLLGLGDNCYEREVHDE